MGMKIAVNQTKEEIEKNKAEAGLQDPIIKILDETKVIAGYKCKKAEVTTGEEVIEVYYTEEIAVPAGMNDDNGFKGINGMLMQYTINQQGMIMTMTAKEVKKAKVKGGLFLIPDDYDVKTMEELGGMFGG
jgi:GLPGLI family protein